MEVPRPPQKRKHASCGNNGKFQEIIFKRPGNHRIKMPVVKTEKLKKERLAPKGKKAHNLSNVATRKTRTLQQPANKSFVQHSSTMKTKA